MCGRYSLTTAPEAMRRLFKITGPLRNLPARYNIAPTQDAPVVRVNRKTGERELVSLRWGLIPFWSKGPGSAPQMINARAETVASKPAYRESFAQRRCLVPADGFFEWRQEGRIKQPYRVTLEGGEPMAFAGLWASWRNPAGEKVESFCIVVTDSSEDVAETHDRMPVILDPADWDTWLEAGPEELDRLQELLKPYTKKRLILTAVSRRVSDPKNDDPDCIAPLVADGSTGAEASAPEEKQLDLLR